MRLRNENKLFIYRNRNFSQFFGLDFMVFYTSYGKKLCLSIKDKS